MIKHTIELGAPDDETTLATQLQLLADHIPTAWVRVVEAPWRGNDNYVVDVLLLDPADEMVEEDLAGQIRVLLARLIAGEAAEMEAGSPAAKSLAALVNALCALDWWEQVDEAEDAEGVAEQIEDVAEGEMPAARSLTLATARAIADRLTVDTRA